MRQRMPLRAQLQAQQELLAAEDETVTGLRQTVPPRRGGPCWAQKPRTEAFREWFGFSRVKTVVFHATTADFTAFDCTRSDLGAHFGAAEQMNHLRNRMDPRGAMRVLPVWLSLQNPLRLTDIGSFHADAIAPELERRKLLPRGEGKRIRQEIDANWRLRETYDPMVREAILKAGYDGVVYRNTQEGDSDSYIAFFPEQIKSALCNVGTFDPKDPDLRR